MNRIAIIMDGGIIQNILADEEVYTTIVDLDTEDAEEVDLTKILLNNRTSVEALIYYPTEDFSDEARKILDMLDRLTKEGEHEDQNGSG